MVLDVIYQKYEVGDGCAGCLTAVTSDEPVGECFLEDSNAAAKLFEAWKEAGKHNHES